MKKFFQILLVVLFFFGINLSEQVRADDIFNQPICDKVDENGNPVNCLQSVLSQDTQAQVDPALNPQRTFREQVLIIVNYFLSFAGLAAVISLLYGAFLWIFAGGDDENIGKGKKIILYSGAGIILILLSFTIVRFFVSAAGGTETGTLTTIESPASLPRTTANPDGTFTTLQGVTLPPRVSILSDGTLTAPNGVVYPARIVTNPDGSVTITDPNGNPFPKGTRFLPDGTIMLPDGTLFTFPENSSISAAISGGPSSGKAPLTIQLSGLNSRYPGADQTIPDSAFEWSYMDRDGKKISLGSGHTLVHTLNESGRFVFTLQVKKRDNGPETSDGTATFAVEVFEASPDVDFFIEGKPSKLFQQFALEEAVNGLTFTPQIENTKHHQIEEYSWDFGDGSTPLRSSDPEGVNHIYSRNGEFFVSLTVTDALGTKSTRKVQVLITDVAARIQSSPLQKIVGDPIVFTAENSLSSFGDILETNWTLIDNEGNTIEKSEETFAHTFENSGNVQVSLSVRDSSGKTGATTETIFITSHPPVALFRAEKKSSSTPATFVFDAGNSSDIDGDSLLYSWDFQNDGIFEITRSNRPQEEHSFSELGTHRIKLRVEDQNGEKDEVVNTIEVDSLLNVDFRANTLVAHPDEDITFVAASDNALMYYWDFGDGTTAQGANDTAHHSYKEKGRYPVELTVFDLNDQENTVQKTIFIGEKDMPVAVARVQKQGQFQMIQTDHCGSEKNGLSISRNQVITFDAGDSINRDGSAGNLEYEWVFHDGTFSEEKVVRKRFDEFPDKNICFPVQLTVRDEETQKTDIAQTIWLQIDNAPPAFDSLTVLLPENTTAPVIVPLTVQNPRDPDGSIVEYKWWAYREGQNEKIGLHTTSASATSIILPAHGLPNEKNTYYFVVEAKDNFGAVLNSQEYLGKSTFVEVVNGENRSPIVDFKMERNTVTQGDTLTFFGQASDPLGSTIPNSAYMWDFNGDNIFDAVGTGPQVTHRFERPGEYQVRLKVVHRGLASSKIQSVFVSRVHKLPRAAFTFSVQGHKVVFNAGNSQVDASVPNNTPEFFWDFDTTFDSDGDGDPANDQDSYEQRAQYIYTEFGTRSVKLTIMDRLGVQDEVIREVPVGASGKVVASSTSGDLNFSGIWKSIRLLSNQPMTTLDVVLEKSTISPKETVKLFTFVKNANNTFFDGGIEFKVVSGTVTLSNERIQSVLGEGVIEITGNSREKAVIEVTAKNTVSGDLVELVPLTIE